MQKTPLNAVYSPNVIPIFLALETTSHSGSTNFNLPAVSLKGIALISFLSKTTSFPKSLFKRRFAPYTPKRVAIKRS